MISITTTTPRLTLLPVDVPICEAFFAGAEKLSQLLNIELPTVIDLEYGAEPFRYTYDRIKDNPGDSAWWMMLLFIHQQDRTLAGLGGYKGPPDPQGMVEIGYQIYEPYRNQGLATEAANGMINRAFEHPDVNLVQAHTLAEENASVRVLKKCGMVFTGAFDDPDDGPIWQWQLPRS